MSKKELIEHGKNIPTNLGPKFLSLLFSKVTVTSSGCWIRKSYTDKEGYSRIKLNGRDLLAHRVSYALFNDDYSLDGWDIHHLELCSSPACINPKHLQKEDTYVHRKRRKPWAVRQEPIPF